MSLVEISRLPRHVAIVMDGNGRWAQQRGCARTDGHEEGSKAVRRIVRATRRLGIDALTLYAFSEQNWVRPQQETDALMELLRRFLIDEREEMLENGIALRPAGRLHKLPSSVRDILDPLAAETRHLQGMTLTLCVSYGGREEILDATRALAERAAAGELDPQSIDAGTLESFMPSTDMGPVDLLVRTGGEPRISNFVLWGAAYAELCFTPRLWPDYAEGDYFEAIAAYQKRERRFGAVPSDVEPAAHPVASAPDDRTVP